MGLFQCQRQRLRFGGEQDQMHMIRHQTVTQQRNRVERKFLPQQLQIDGFFRFGREQKLPGVPTLGDMVRYISYCDTCQARHTSETNRKPPVSSVPRFQKFENGSVSDAKGSVNRPTMRLVSNNANAYS